MSPSFRSAPSGLRRRSRFAGRGGLPAKHRIPVPDVPDGAVRKRNLLDIQHLIAFIVQVGEDASDGRALRKGTVVGIDVQQNPASITKRKRHLGRRDRRLVLKSDLHEARVGELVVDSHIGGDVDAGDSHGRSRRRSRRFAAALGGVCGKRKCDCGGKTDRRCKTMTLVVHKKFFPPESGFNRTGRPLPIEYAAAERCVQYLVDLAPMPRGHRHARRADRIAARNTTMAGAIAR